MRMIRNRCRITVRGPGVQLVFSMRRAESVPTHSLRRLRVGLVTWVAIEATAESEGVAARAIEAAYAEVCEVERRMHPEREGSDIARINLAPLRVRTPIHASTWEVLRLAQRLNDLTRGEIGRASCRERV